MSLFRKSLLLDTKPQKKGGCWNKITCWIKKDAKYALIFPLHGHKEARKTRFEWLGLFGVGGEGNSIPDRKFVHFYPLASLANKNPLISCQGFRPLTPFPLPTHSPFSHVILTFFTNVVVWKMRTLFAVLLDWTNYNNQCYVMICLEALLLIHIWRIDDLIMSYDPFVLRPLFLNIKHNSTRTLNSAYA